MSDNPCLPAAEVACTTTTCGERCAVSAIDGLLARGGDITGDDADHLLDLRSLIRGANDAEAALREFCEVRRRLENGHYLALYRIRRWMENHLVGAVRLCPEAEPKQVAVPLDFYCVEAVRRACLCRAMEQGVPLLAPRIDFQWRAVHGAAPVRSAPGRPAVIPAGGVRG